MSTIGSFSELLEKLKPIVLSWVSGPLNVTVTTTAAHELANTGALGLYHTVGGLTAGQFLRASAATTADFRALIAADLPNTAVTPAGYGSATQVGTFTVDAQGRLTAAANVTISGVVAAAHNLLSAIHGDTTTASAVRGDIITGQGASPLWTRLAISAPASGLMNYFGAANGDAEPGYKALFDATVPGTIAESASAAAGTATVSARRDHTHGAPATWAATAHDIVGAKHTIAGAALSLVGAATLNTLGLITPSSNPGAVAAILASDSNGAIQLVNATLTGNLNTSRVASHLIPSLVDTYDLGSSTLLWRKGYLSEMDALLFSENTITLLGGWFYVGKDAGVLGADVGTGDTTINFGKAMTNGHFVLFRTALAVEYVQVGSVVSGTTYNVTRNLDGSGANAWAQGTPFAVMGTTGDGRIELNAYDTPRISMMQQGATYNTQTELIRIGDLNGNWGYSAETWGLAIGEYASGKANLIASAGVLKLRNYATDVIVFDTTESRIDNLLKLSGANAAIALGTAPPTSATVGTGIWLDRTGLYGLVANAEKVKIDAVTGLLTATGATLSGTVTATAGAIGGWTLAATTIASKGVTLTSGVGLASASLAFGATVPTSPTTGTGIYIDETGLYGLSANVQQAYINATGQLLAGAGNVTLDVNGVTLLTNSGAANGKLKFKDETFVLSDVASSTTLSTVYYGNLGLNVYNDSGTWRTGFTLLGYEQRLELLGALYVGDGTGTKPTGYNATLMGGLNLGSATGAATGDAGYSGALRPYKNSTLYSAYAFVPLAAPLTSTSWDGDSFSTTAKTIIDLSAVFSAPAGIKAVLVACAMRDSGSAASDVFLMLSPGDTAASGIPIDCSGLANDAWERASLVVPCDANGDIYYQIAASGASTMDVYLEIWGYYI